MRAVFLVAALLASIPSARADMWLAVGNGDVVRATIGAPGEIDSFRVQCPAGVRLEVTAAPIDAGPPLAVSLLDRDFAVVQPRVEGPAPTLVEPVTTAALLVQVAAQDGTSTGDYEISFSWAAPRQAAQTPTLRSRETAQASFVAGRGDVAVIEVRPARGSKARPRLRSVFDQYDFYDPPHLLRGGRRRAVVELTRISQYGVSVANDASAAGDVVVSVKLRGARRKLALSGALVPADHSVIDAAPIGPRGAASLVGETVSMRVSPSPGVIIDDTIFLDDARVEVPRGALRSSGVLWIAAAPDFPPGVVGLRPVGRAMFVGASDFRLRAGRHVTVTLPVSVSLLADQSPRVFALREDGSTDEIPAEDVKYDSQYTRLTFDVDRLGTFCVFARIPQALGAVVAAGEDRIAVGIPGATVDGRVNAGAVRILVRSGSSWIEETTITDPVPGDDDRFGASVALSGDTLLAGSPGTLYAAAPTRSAYVFVRGGDGLWTRQWTFHPTPDPAVVADDFGSSVALDGDVAVIGCPYELRDGKWVSAVYVFERDGGSWSAGRRLESALGPDQFGAVALSGDTLLVGRSSDAVVFVRSGGGWDVQARLTPSGEAAGDWQGIDSIALDGDTAVVGSVEHSVFGGSGRGAAYVFSRDAGTWTERAVLRPAESGLLHFGASLAVRNGRILVGAPFHGDSETYPPGAAYLYSDDPLGPTLLGVIGADDQPPHRYLGTSVALTSSGTTAVLCEYFESSSFQYEVP